jgi:superfamily II DNA/RNA helicase
VARLHGDREQNQRDEAMAGFRQGRYRVLIATDIAARGLDVADIEHVINFDFPRSPEDYIHRIGRTARLAADGRATSFVTPKDRGLLRDLERLLGSKIPLTPAPGSKVAVQPDAAPGRSPAHGRPHTAPAAAHGRSGAHAARAHDRSGAHAARAHDRSGTPAATASAQASAGAGPGRRRRRGRGRGGARPVPQGLAGGPSAPSAAPHAHASAAPHAHVVAAPADAAPVPTAPAQGAPDAGHRQGRRRRRGGRHSAAHDPSHGMAAAVRQAEVQAAAPVGQHDARPAAQDRPGPDNVAAQPPENGWPAIARFGWELAE